MADRRRPPSRVHVRGRILYRCPGCGAQRGQDFARDLRVSADELLTDAHIGDRVAAGRVADPPATPCPRCGARFDRAVARKRQWWDQWAVAFVPAGLLLGLLTALVARHPWVYWLLILLAPALVAFELVWVWRVGRRFPTLAGKTGPDGEPFPAEPRPRRPLAYATLGMAAVALLVHPAYRALGRIPLNDRCEPMVVGPGSRVRLFVDNDLSAVKGDWGGTGRVAVVNAADVRAPAALPAEVPPPIDRESIRAKSDEARETPDTYAAVTLPDDPALAGRALRLRIDLAVTYPEPAGPGQFRYAQADLADEREVTLCSAAAAAADRRVGWLGSVAGGVLTVLAGALILGSDRRLRRAAPPPAVVIHSIDE